MIPGLSALSRYIAVAAVSAAVTGYTVHVRTRDARDLACANLVLQARQAQAAIDAASAAAARASFEAEIRRIDQENTNRAAALEAQIAQDGPETRPACALTGSDIDWLRAR